MNRISRGNPSPIRNQYICFCLTYRYLFLAVLFRNLIQSKRGGSQNSAGVAKSFELGMFLGGDGEMPGAHFNLEMVAQLVKNPPAMQETWD